MPCCVSEPTSKPVQPQENVFYAPQTDFKWPGQKQKIALGTLYSPHILPADGQPRRRVVNFEQSSLDWSNEGRYSERCRRLSFLLLFTPEGHPRYWLILFGVVCSAVIFAGLGD
jgi:hypothetical protein